MEYGLVIEVQKYLDQGFIQTITIRKYMKRFLFLALFLGVSTNLCLAYHPTYHNDAGCPTEEMILDTQLKIEQNWGGAFPWNTPNLPQADLTKQLVILRAITYDAGWKENFAPYFNERAVWDKGEGKSDVQKQAWKDSEGIVQQNIAKAQTCTSCAVAPAGLPANTAYIYAAFARAATETNKVVLEAPGQKKFCGEAVPAPAPAVPHCSKGQLYNTRTKKCVKIVTGKANVGAANKPASLVTGRPTKTAIRK